MMLNRLPLSLLASALAVSAFPQTPLSHANLDSQNHNTHSSIHPYEAVLPSATPTSDPPKPDRTYDDVRCGCGTKLDKNAVENAMTDFLLYFAYEPSRLELDPGKSAEVTGDGGPISVFAINHTPQKIKLSINELRAALDKIKNICQPNVPGTAGIYGKGAKDGYAVGFMAKGDFDVNDWDGSIWASEWISCA